ncbi:hypothetical protein VT03_23550 [Planctomyces sp. SH-PL14]|nr:hypothetical protein VT03_23550 [Planctomyces sp. SH-PL14]
MSRRHTLTDAPWNQIAGVVWLAALIMDIL